MRLLRSSAVWLVTLVVCAGAGRCTSSALGGPAAHEQAPPSPLRLIPAEADVLLELKSPTRLADLVRHLDLLKEVQTFAIVKEQLDSTQARRARQLLAYVEQTLAGKWPDLLDRLAGGGAALGVKFRSGAPIFLLVVQGKDEKLLDRFLKLSVAVLEDELARQESKDKIVAADFQGTPGYRVGKELLIARAGAALLLSNHKDALGKALELHSGKANKSLANHPALAESDKLLPKGALFRAWLNLAPIHASPAGKDLYKSPRDNAALTVLFGEFLDVLGRSPWLCAGVAAKKDGFLFTVRAPRGRDGMGAERDLHLPPAGKPGSRPLLEPKGVMYSSSFYLDVSRIWKDRAKLFPRAQVAGLEAADKADNPVARQVKLSKLLESAGAYHRLVAVNQPKAGYKKQPQQGLPAFAIVTEMGRPDRFARWADAGLRAIGLLVTNQFGMKLEEETYKEYEIVGYRFDESAELKSDVTDIRFNFSPCFVRVDDQFVLCSTIELGRELVDLLIAEKKQPGKGSEARGQDRYYSAGFANLVEKFSDQLVTQTILDQAVPPKEAHEEVRRLIRLVRNLGTLSTSTRFGAKDFRFDLRLTTK